MNPPKKTRVPARVVSTPPVVGFTENCTPGEGPRPLPKMVMSSPGAIAPDDPLAEFTMEVTTTVEVGGVGLDAPVTVSITVTVCGLLETPAAEIEIVPKWGPAERFAGLMETVSNPVADEVMIQGALAVADHVNVPPPLFATVTV